MTTSKKSSKSTLWVILIIAIVFIAYLSLHHSKKTIPPVTSQTHSLESRALTAPTHAVAITPSHAISDERQDNQSSTQH